MAKQLDIPDGMQNGLLVIALPSGMLQITLIRNRSIVGDIEVKPALSAGIAFQLLSMAKAAHDKTGKPLPDRTKHGGEWFTLEPSKLGLGPCQIPEHEALIASFGEAELGIAIPRKVLRGLGEALFALSADGRQT